MAGAKFEYDEKGTTFYYFLISFFGLILIPLTYYAWTNTKLPEEKTKRLKVCRCPPCLEKRELLKKKQPNTKTIRYASLAVIAALWAVFFAGAYQVSQFERDFTEYDPYAILELDQGASVAEVRRQFRRLSMIYHPDKETGDAVKFMKISKAHAALTNEEAKKNFDEYGNPDGPGATNFGIALPSWLVSKENSMWVLGAYGLAFMVILPLAVGTWWYKSIQYSADQILLDTSQLYFFFFRKTSNMQVKRVLMILAASMEFEKGHNNEIQERPSDNVELPELMRDLPNLNVKNKEPPLCYRYSMKARVLIHAHLSRLDLPEKTLKLDLNLILKKSPFLLQEMVSIISQMIFLAKNERASNMPRLEMLENCIRVSQMICQGLWEKNSPLLQLPHLTQDCLRHFSTKKRNIRSIKQLVSMKEEDRRSLLRSFSDEQYEDIMAVCSAFPAIEVKARAHVLDDEEDGLVTAGSIVTVTVHLKRRTLGEFFEQETSEAQASEPSEQTEVTGPVQASNQKVWQKNKKKGKKSKPNKRQAKKKPVKPAAKKKAAEDKENNLNEDEEEKKDEQEQDDEDEDDKVEAEEEKEDGDVGEEADEKPDDDGNAPGRADNQANESDSLTDTNGSSDEESDSPRRKDAVDTEDEEEWDKLQANQRRDVLDPKSKDTHSIHAPYFPEDKQEWWWLYITDRRRTALVSVPKQVLSLKDEEEIDLKFQAPEKPNTYHYTVTLRSDAYLDCDVHQNFKIDVQEAKEVEVKQWDFESDEDKDEDEESEYEYEEEEEEGSD